MPASAQTSPPGVPRGLFAARVMALAGLLVASTLFTSTAVATGCLLAALWVGVSHGAFDLDLVASHRDAPSMRATVGLYLLALVVTAAAWAWTPGAATVVFLLLSVQHFGDGDLHHPSSPLWLRRTLAASRGVMVVGCTLVAAPTASAPVLQALADTDAAWATPTAWLGTAPGPATLAVGGLGLAHALVVLGLAPRRVHAGRELLETGLLVALFGVAGPFVGFAAFFVLCHGADHVVATFRRVHGESNEGRDHGLWRRTIITGVLGLFAAGGAALWATRGSSPLSTEAVAAMLQVIACFTIPHALVVAWIDPSASPRQP